ncbi:hypothetical protein L1049_003136 [Liquidambar formosana]|uniref:F-box domain-containing protein n=1 Tax=Liquidambar formosana TaxID=63359 RepID=A0AAP0R8M5_LIQFO
MKAEVATMRSGTVSGTSMSEQQTSADVIAGSDDLLTEILRRLPIKSLLQFKSVSQHWCSLISGPDFSRLRFPNPKSAKGLYLYHPAEQGCLINFLPFVYESGTVPFRSITFKDPQTPRCFQSCNGLLCVCLVKKSCCGFVVSNTTTWQSTRFVKLGGGFLGFSLAFDPLKSPHYKVVCVRSYYAPLRLFQIEIYSSETGFWRASGETFAAQDNFLFGGGVFWNGAIHWVSTGGTSLCFDLDEEKFRAMPPMPPIPNGWDRRSISYFGESEGHLHLVQIYHFVLKVFLAFDHNIPKVGQVSC